MSLLIAAIGLVSNWYANSIQKQLLVNNIETTNLVRYTAELEKNLYQSLIYLSAIKENAGNEASDLTLDEPSVYKLSEEFNSELDRAEELLRSVSDFLNTSEISDTTETMPDIIKLEDRMLLYRRLSTDWLILNEDDKVQAQIVFNNSISPYFRNNIIPTVSHFREHAINLQTKENASLNEQLENANLGIRVFTGLFVLLSLLMGFYIYKSIADPLKKMIKGTERVGRGDLDKPIKIDNDDELGQLAASFNDMATSLKKRTLAKDYLDNIIESIQEALIVTDSDGLVVGINKAAQKMLHYSKEDAMGLSVEKFYDFENHKEKYDLKSRSNSVFEFSLITKRGRKIPVLFSESDLINASGELVGKVAVATDITKRKQDEEKIRQSLKEKEVLLSEIHHRVKNNLAVISGILQLQIYDTRNEEVSKALTESQSRIQSLSLVHEMLYQSDSMAYIAYDSYLKDLLQAISSMHISDDKEIILKADIKPFSLDLNQAIPCSLLINEIIVNSFKHAFKGKENGQILVKMRVKNEMVELIVEDDGVGFSNDKPISKSLGSTLIRTLSDQLHGKLVIENLEKGTGSRTKVIFPKER